MGAVTHFFLAKTTPWCKRSNTGTNFGDANNDRCHKPSNANWAQAANVFQKTFEMGHGLFGDWCLLAGEQAAGHLHLAPSALLSIPLARDGSTPTQRRYAVSGRQRSQVLLVVRPRTRLWYVDPPSRVSHVITSITRPLTDRRRMGECPAGAFHEWIYFLRLETIVSHTLLHSGSPLTTLCLQLCLQ